MEGQVQKPSKILVYSGVATFILLAMWGFFHFFSVAIELYDSINQHPSSISFDNGAFYFFGGAMACVGLVFAIFYEAVLGRALTKRITSWATKFLLVSVAVMFILPQVMHYFVENKLLKSGYNVCESMSTQWFHARTIVYVTNQDVCKQLTDEKKKRFSD